MKRADLFLKPKGLTILVIISTLMIAIAALLINAGLIPIQSSDEAITPSYWHQIVIGAGLLMPLAILIWKRQDSLIRQIIGTYLLLLFAHIVTEIGFVLWLGPAIATIIGLLYSALRLIQLGAALHITTKQNQSYRWLTFVLVFLIGTWGINLVRLFLKFWAV